MGPKLSARPAGLPGLHISQQPIGGRTRIHDRRLSPAGGAIHLSHTLASIDVDKHQARTLARESDHGSPAAAHAAVIHGAAPTYAQRAEGGEEREDTKPVGMRMADLKSSDYPGLNFSNLYKNLSPITAIDFTATHTVEEITEGLLDPFATRFKTWNISLQRGDNKYVIKIFIDGDDNIKIGKGLGEGFKSRTLFSESSGNLFINNGRDAIEGTGTITLLIHAFQGWDDNNDPGQYFPPIYAEISGGTLTFRFIPKATFDASHEGGEIKLATPSVQSTAPTPSPAATLTFPGSDLMRSGMEMAGIAPVLIEDALTNIYLLTELAGMGVTDLGDQQAVIEALDLKANMRDLGSLQEALAGFDSKTISFLQEAKDLGNTKLYAALRGMDEAGFNLPVNRADIVSLFDLSKDPTKVEDALAALSEFDQPINITVLKNAKAACDISLYPLLNRLHTDGIDDLALAQTLIDEYELSPADLKADGQPKYTEAMAHYKAFAGKAYDTEVVTEAKTWAMDDSIQVPDVIGVLINFLDGEDSADKDLIFGAFMVALGNGDQSSLTAILGFGKAYARATADQRESARDLLSGYTEGDYGSASGKDRFVRLLQKQTP